MSIKLTLPSWKILLAVSWWIDSTALLHLLHKHNNLIAWHFNHNTRGKESDWDEEFVCLLCDQYWIPFFSSKSQITPKSEEEARKLRYDFLIKIYKEQNCDYLALAHHKDDNVETLLMQYIRWTWSGHPMDEYSIFYGIRFWRPLLNYTKQDCLLHAKANSLSWREDQTNHECVFARNKVRRLVIPTISEINPNYRESILKSANVQYQNANFIDNKAKNIISSNKAISKKVFDPLHLSLQRAIIRTLSTKSLSYVQVDEIIMMINSWTWNKTKHWFHLNKGFIYHEDSNFKTNEPVLILASQSPQRRKLIENITSNFLVVPSSYDEKWEEDKTVEENIIHFAERKALDVATKYRDFRVIGCDTFVVHPSNWVYLKPKDINEARKHLISYSNTTVKVLSWITVLSKNKKWLVSKKSEIAITNIYFSEITEKDVDSWLNHNEWQGRSGSCSIEWYTSNFVKRIDGCFFNVIGLPLNLLRQML